jgi:hypothetical protein
LHLASCAGEPTQVVRAQQAIVGGEVSPAGAEDAVLLLHAQGMGYEQICSASLVAPRLVLTARHCVSYLNDGVFRCSLAGELIDNPEGGGQLGLHLEPESIGIYGGQPPRGEPLARGAKILSTLSPSICSDDLAFVLLDRSLDFTPLSLRVGRPAAIGEAVTLLGYGVERERDQIDIERQPRRRKSGLLVTDVGPDLRDQDRASVPPRVLGVEGLAGCVGDSGGPLLSDSTDAILGVYSLLDGASCSDRGVRHLLTHVPPFETLIESAFAAASAEPLLEPGPADPELADPEPADPEPADPELDPAGADRDRADREAQRQSAACAITSARRAGQPGDAAWLLLLVAARRRASSVSRRVDRWRPRPPEPLARRTRQRSRAAAPSRAEHWL